MADNKTDYARTDELGDTLIPITEIIDRTGVSRDTVERRLRGVERVPFRGGKAVRFSDVVDRFAFAASRG